MVKVGDTIRIQNMHGEPHYTGRTGTVKFIDDAGQIHGTFGGLALNENDEFIIIKTAEESQNDSSRRKV